MWAQQKNNAKRAWLGVLADVSHKVLAGFKQKGKMEWFHLLLYYPHSSVLVWPGQLKEEKTRFGPITYFVHEPTLLEPAFIAITDLDNVQGCCFSWKWERIKLHIYLIACFQSYVDTK